MEGFKTFLGDMCIYLCGRQITMSQQQLDNAQIWEQLDSSRLTLKTGEGILIKSARLGSFLLEKQTGSRSIRVKRID